MTRRAGLAPAPDPRGDATPLVEVEGLTIRFPLERGWGYAVRGVSLSIGRGEVLGLVGESGSGKTLTGLALLGLVPPPGEVTAGAIVFRDGRGVDAGGLEGRGRKQEARGERGPGPAGDDTRGLEGGGKREEGRGGGDGRFGGGGAGLNHGGVDIVRLPRDGEAIRALRGAEIAMIFQEPMTSLTPVYTVGSQIEEMVRLHRGVGRREARERAIEMLRRVGIPDPHRRVDEYPHQLSGGMRQRVMIAMALSCDPALLVADEPTTALDVTIQAQILDLLQQLREETGMAILLISHDLGVIATLADRVAVMYAGQIVEEGPAEALFHDPRHPYTRGLLRSAPALGRPRGERLYSIPGTVPPLHRLPEGCAFQPRCPLAEARCAEPQELVETGGRSAARCWKTADANG